MFQKPMTFLLTGIFLLGLTSLLYAQEIPSGTGTWDSEKYGNHRIVIHVKNPANAVRAHMVWRRRDRHPEKKNIIIIDAKTGQQITNLYRHNINRESGDIIFQPHTVPGDYYVYYLPYFMKGRSNYPSVLYPEPENTADNSWLQKHGLDKPGFTSNSFQESIIKGMQSINEFNSFYPMELIATKKETTDLIQSSQQSSYLLFPENRRYPIRMTGDIPYRWIKTGLQNSFSGEACRGEFYAFQIGVFASKKAIKDINVNFSDLSSKESGTRIPSSAFQSINTEGINWDGQAFNKVLPIEKGKIQALWCGVQIPKGVQAGQYKSFVTIKPEGEPESIIELNLNITEEVLADSGDSEPWKHSRLRWLNSKIAFDDQTVAPFIPMIVNENTVSCLGRSLDINSTGFPGSIRSFFSPEVTSIQSKSVDILSAPIKLIVETEEGDLSWKPDELKIILQKPGAVEWEVELNSGQLKLALKARMESDGFVKYDLKLNSDLDISIKDIRLEIPLSKEVTQYMLGMGRKGGFCPDEFEWKWDQTKNQDAFWIGTTHAGLYASFRAENYSRPLNTNFYLSKPLNLPPSWFNDGKGGCEIKQKNSTTTSVSLYSGERTLHSGEELHYDFILLITPFKPIDTKLQWSTRFYHSYKPIEEIAKSGANTINNHHATEANPYINYPFIHTKQMKGYIDEAHSRGMKVNIYNTIRELSNRAPELFALQSLGHEIFSTGKGGGFSWLQEHFGSDYIAAWFVPQLKDAAVINSGMSRWHNYYLEGLDWLVKNIGIDGLYIDDVAYDRTTMKRVRKILDKTRQGALIDLHSANQFNPRDGFINSTILYLEHFPYINRLWFGEYFDYGSKPEFWLTELSGIPFGLMGEMLQDGGNPWRGMVYGMTSRLPWTGNPKPLWDVWDDFAMEDSQMVGYWSERCPVKTGHKDILATAYVKKDSVLIALASWAEKKTDCTLEIDWKALGLDPKKTKLYSPRYQRFSVEALFNPSDKIPLKPGKGYLLILK